MRSVCSYQDNDYDIHSIVVDLGGDAVKGGFDHHSFPAAVFRSRVGYEKYKHFPPRSSVKKFVSAEADVLDPVLKFENPIQRGEVVNWDHFEYLFHQLFYLELNVAPEEHPIAINRPPLSSKPHHEKTMQIMFETFNNPAFKHIAPFGCILAAEGRTSGMVLECGHDLSFAGAVFDGYGVKESINRSLYGGKDVTRLLAEKLIPKRKSFSQTSEMNIIRDIKEQFGNVALDYIQEKSSIRKSLDYMLPHGNILQIDKEPWEAAESLFIPALAKVEANGVIDLLEEAFSKCAIDSRRNLYQNIMLSGGSSHIKNYAEKIRNEMKKILPVNAEIIVNESFSPETAFWRGAAVTASHPSFQVTWISKEEYDESGPYYPRRRGWF